MRRAVRYLLAIERVKTKAKQHNLTDEQKGQLRERESTEKAAAESAFLKLYTEVWLPRVDLSAAAQAGGSGIGIEPVAVGGRPLQTTLSEKKEALIHERVMELVMQVQKRVFDTVTPGKVVEFFKLGDLPAEGSAQAGGTPRKLGITTGEIVNGFYSFLGFTRLISEKVVAKAIAAGVAKRIFGYIGGGDPTLGDDAKYQVTPAKVRFDFTIAEDEIDLESGFIMLPQAIPQSSPTGANTGGGPDAGDGSGPGSGTGTGRDTGTGTAGQGTGGATGGGDNVTSRQPSPERKVELTFTADRDKLYGAWNAMANLAEMAGHVTVTVKAESEAGFDKSKLTNGVLEPLREADLIQ